MGKIVVGPKPSDLDKKVVAWLNGLKPGLGNDLVGYSIERRVNDLGVLKLELFFNTDDLEQEEGDSDR